jgi:hypothetical protein
MKHTTKVRSHVRKGKRGYSPVRSHLRNVYVATSSESGENEIIGVFRTRNSAIKAMKQLIQEPIDYEDIVGIEEYPIKD